MDSIKRDEFHGLDAGTVQETIQANQSTVDAFHSLYYHNADQTWETTHWLGYPLLKCPLDLWIYQEIIVAVQPDLIIESGTYYGGSALYFASILDLLNKSGEIITIDIEQRNNLPKHPRINYLKGSSVAADIFKAVQTAANECETILVVLDSDHTSEHVIEELSLYAPLVSRGSYIIVEDTNINGNPVRPTWGSGPMEAITSFLAANKDFVSDRRCEKYFFTQNPKGYLKRK